MLIIHLHNIWLTLCQCSKSNVVDFPFLVFKFLLKSTDVQTQWWRFSFSGIKPKRGYFIIFPYPLYELRYALYELKWKHCRQIVFSQNVYPFLGSTFRSEAHANCQTLATGLSSNCALKENQAQYSEEQKPLVITPWISAQHLVLSLKYTVKVTADTTYINRSWDKR